jgi:hypothetical protein
MGGVDEVTMQNSCGVDVAEASEDLIEEELHVLVAERLRREDDLVQVRVHELGDNVAAA